MHQDGCRHFQASKKQKVWRFTCLIATFRKTLYECGSIDAVAVHKDDIPNKHRPLLDGYFPDFGVNIVQRGLALSHRLFLRKLRKQLSHDLQPYCIMCKMSFPREGCKSGASSMSSTAFLDVIRSFSQRREAHRLAHASKLA